jgi:FlaA1/EpsC-like NDP-sugar epimerase
MIPQVIVDWIVLVEVIVSLVASLGFMVRYHFVGRWWKSAIGRHMMSFMTGMTSIMLLAVVVLLFPGVQYRQELRLFCWTLLAFLFVWRFIIILRIKRYDENGNAPE